MRSEEDGQEDSVECEGYDAEWFEPEGFCKLCPNLEICLEIQNDDKGEK